MVARLQPKDFDLTIKFGGGLHTRASEDEIDPREAAAGANFLLDLENRELRNRPPFDLIGQVPNAAEIRGGGSLLKSDGTVSTLIQAGANVYEWGGGTGFTKVGTVVSTAKLRGHWRSQNWQLDDKLLLTDLSLVEVVKEWDGTTFQSVAFTNGTGGASGVAFGTFYAKYLSVSNERAIFSHVRDPGATTRHMIVGSKRGDYTEISSSQRPASSLSEEDPFFLLSPDLRPINGHVEAFGTTVISTEKGQLFNLSGSSAKDFSFADFYPGSAASGEEATAYIGNDIIYGRQGRIESVTDTQRFGDTESDDLTSGIADQIENYTGWVLAYNSRLNRVYLFPDEISECWVFNTAMRGGDLSPWMRWTTEHALAFQPTFVMSMLDPSDGLEYVLMGDSTGHLYRLEGSGTSGDGGQNSILVEWLTKLFAAPMDAEVYQLEGYIKYRKNLAATVTMTFEYSGVAAFDEAVTINIPALSGAAHFGGDYWFGGDVYFGVAFERRLIRQRFQVPGQASDFQMRIGVEGVNAFDINEIGLRFRAASQ
jgi:hypothetical protein